MVDHPSKPSEVDKVLALEANRSFSPPLHEEAETSEELMVAILSEYIADGLLLRRAPGEFYVPEHRAADWAALPSISELVVQRLK